MAVVLPRVCTVTVGGTQFKTKLPHNYTRSRPILAVGSVHLTSHATVAVLSEALYGVTMDDGEYSTVYRAPNGRLIGHVWFVDAVIEAENNEWTRIKIGARG